MFWRIPVILGICLGAVADTIVGNGDFLHNYTLKSGVRIEQTVWGYILFPDKLRRSDGSRYMMTRFDGANRRTDAFTFRFRRRIYPVDPQTAELNPAERYNRGQLNFALTTRRPGSAMDGVCVMGGRIHAGSWSRGSLQSGRGTVYFSNLDNCGNLFKVTEEKVVIYPRENIIMFERNGRREIRSLDRASEYSYYGFYEFPQDEKFLINEFSDIVLWNRLDPAPTRLHDSYYRHVYTGYRNDGRYSLPEMEYWRGRSFYDGGFEVPRNFPDAVAHFRKAAADKHVFGIYYLGLCHYFGVGVPQDRDAALVQLREAAYYQYDQAMALYGFLTGSRDMLEKAALQGNAEALFRTGELEKAAARGHAKALYQLGLQTLERGELEAARETFKKTLELRFAPGITRLAELTAAPRAAYALNVQAAELGDPDAMFNAAWYLYRNNKDLDIARGYITSGVVLDHPLCKVALALFERGSEEGAKRFFSGDRAGAVAYWEANPGPYGYYAAGICYLNGLGVGADRVKGMALMESALKGGVGEAGFELGRLLEADGLDKEAAEAYGKSELPQARLALAGLLKKGNGIPGRIAELLGASAAGGNLEAMRLYAEYLYSTTPRRPSEASDWWGKYLDGRIARDNNSVDGPYWRELPCCLPVETRDGMPLDYFSELKDPARVREFYLKYGH